MSFKLRRHADADRMSPFLQRSPFRAATAGALQHAQRKAHDLKHVTLQRLRCWIQQDNSNDSHFPWLICESGAEQHCVISGFLDTQSLIGSPCAQARRCNLSPQHPKKPKEQSSCHSYYCKPWPVCLQPHRWSTLFKTARHDKLY